MNLHVIEAGNFKLDGGAMYGVVPKKIWNHLNPADDNNLCTWSMRCLLIETADRKILIDTGLGNKQDDKFFSHYEPSGNMITQALEAKGFRADEITDVFLTHFHFDHVGGAVTRDASGRLIPTFENAVYWTNKLHYEWAYDPNPREKASFLKENFVPLLEEGVLQFIDTGDRVEWLEGIEILFCNGHTEAQMLPVIPYGDQKLVYCADLLPSSTHIGLPYIMAYDIRPLDTLREKEQLIQKAFDENYILFFEHDPAIAACTLSKNEKGKIITGNTVQL